MAAWVSLIILAIVSCLNFLDRQILAILIPAIKADLQLTDTQLGALSGLAFALLYSLLSLPVARLADRTDRSRVVSLSLTAWSLLTMACGLALNFWQLALARLFVGIGEAGGTAPSHALAASRMPPEKRSLALAILSLGIPMGILMGMLVGGIVGQALGWRWAFVIAGLPGPVVAILVHFFARDERSAAERASSSEANLGETIRALWSIPAYRYLLSGAIFFTAANYGWTQWLASFLVRSHGLDLKGAGLTLGLLFGVLGSAGTLTGGFIGDALGKSSPRWAFWVPALSILFFVPCFMASTWSQSFAGFVYMTIFPVFLSFLYMGPTYGTIQKFALPQQRATAAAFSLCVINLIGLGLGPLSIGMLTDALTSTYGKEALRHAMLWLVAAAGLIASACYFLAAAVHKENQLR